LLRFDVIQWKLMSPKGINMSLANAAGHKRRRLQDLLSQCAEKGWDEYTLFEKFEEFLSNTKGGKRRFRNIRAYLDGNTYTKPRAGKRPQVRVDVEAFCKTYGISGKTTLDTVPADFGLLFAEKNHRHSNMLQQYRDASFNQFQIGVDQLETYQKFKTNPVLGKAAEIKIAKEGEIYWFDYFCPGKPRSYRGHVVATDSGIIYFIGYENATNYDECIFMMLFEPQDLKYRGEVLLGVQAGVAKAWDDNHGPRLIGRRIGLSRQGAKKGAEPHSIIMDWLWGKGDRDNTSLGFTVDTPAKLDPGLD
jgi:hypothetical protein